MYSFGSTYTKIGTIQRRLAWPLHKDDTHTRIEKCKRFFELLHLQQSIFQPELYNNTSLLLISVLRIVHVLALAFGEPTKEGQGQCHITIRYYNEKRQVLVSSDWRGMTTYAL